MCSFVILGTGQTRAKRLCTSRVDATALELPRDDKTFAYFFHNRRIIRRSGLLVTRFVLFPVIFHSSFALNCFVYLPSIVGAICELNVANIIYRWDLTSALAPCIASIPTSPPLFHGRASRFDQRSGSPPYSTDLVVRSLQHSHSFCQFALGTPDSIASLVTLYSHC